MPVPANNQRFARRHNRASIAVGCYHAKAVVPGFFALLLSRLIELARSRQERKSSDSSCVVAGELLDLRWSLFAPDCWLDQFRDPIVRERSDPTANDGGQVETGQRLLLSRLLTRLAGAFNSSYRSAARDSRLATDQICCSPPRLGQQLPPPQNVIIFIIAVDLLGCRCPAQWSVHRRIRDFDPLQPCHPRQARTHSPRAHLGSRPVPRTRRASFPRSSSSSSGLTELL